MNFKASMQRHVFNGYDAPLQLQTQKRSKNNLILYLWIGEKQGRANSILQDLF